MTILKVSIHSRSSAVAGAIAGVIRDHGAAEVQAIGAGAVNQAAKAIAIARGFLIPEGMDIACRLSFTTVILGGEERTAMRFAIEPETARSGPALREAGTGAVHAAIERRAP